MDAWRNPFFRFVFEKTFPTCLTLDHLQGALTADNVYMELLQVKIVSSSGPGPGQEDQSQASSSSENLKLKDQDLSYTVLSTELNT